MRPVTLRAALALAGDGEPGPGAARPWPSLAGSRLAAMAEVPALAMAPVGRVLDRLRASLERVPLAAAAAALLAVPIVRAFAGDGAAGTPVVLLCAGFAALVPLLRLNAALHSGSARALAGGALLAGLVLRIVAAAVVSSRGGFPDERGYYHPVAAETAASWALGGSAVFLDYPLTAGREAYYGLLSGVYLLLGSTPATGRLLGIVLGLLAALLAGELARSLAGPRAAAAGVALLALHPEHVLWSTTLTRDTLSTVLALAALVLLLRPAGRGRLSGFIGTALCTALLFRNSFLVGGAVAVVLLAVLAARAVRGTMERRPWGLPSVLLILFVVAAGLMLLARHWGPWFRPEMLSAVRNRGLDAESVTGRELGWISFLPGLEFHGVLDVLAYVPLGALFVLAAPFPWEAHSASRFAYAGIAAVGLVLTACGVIGLFAGLRRRPGPALVMGLFVGALLLALAVLEASSGIVVRHRLPLTAVLVAAAAPLFTGNSREVPGA